MTLQGSGNNVFKDKGMLSSTCCPPHHPLQHSRTLCTSSTPPYASAVSPKKPPSCLSQSRMEFVGDPFVPRSHPRDFVILSTIPSLHFGITPSSHFFIFHRPQTVLHFIAILSRTSKSPSFRTSTYIFYAFHTTLFEGLKGFDTNSILLGDTNSFPSFYFVELRHSRLYTFYDIGPEDPNRQNIGSHFLYLIT